MAKFEVEVLKQVTTSTGKLKGDCVLREVGTGIQTENVTIWGDFAGFSEITFGSIVEGDLVAAKDPKYGPTLYPQKPTTSPKRASGGVSTAMMNKKAETIEHAQNRRAEGVQVAATMRDATLIAIEDMRALGKIEPWDRMFKERWNAWHTWLNQKWDGETDGTSGKPF